MDMVAPVEDKFNIAVSQLHEIASAERNQWENYKTKSWEFVSKIYEFANEYKNNVALIDGWLVERGLDTRV